MVPVKRLEGSIMVLAFLGFLAYPLQLLKFIAMPWYGIGAAGAVTDIRSVHLFYGLRRLKRDLMADKRA